MKIMKKLMMIIALAAVTLGVNAQHDVGTLSIQPKVGVTFSKITDLILYNSTIGDTELKKEYKVGYQFGVEFEYQFAPQMSVAAGVVYSDQGVKFGNASIITNKKLYTLKDTKYDIDYINIPIVFNYYLTEGFAIKTGIQPAFLTRAKIKYTEVIDDVSTKTNGDIKDNYKTFDFSIPVGFSYEVSNVVLDGRYNIGLTKINKANIGTEKNSVFQFTVGYKFDL